jgi:ADP-heptose:LPS heptosyltransferase
LLDVRHAVPQGLHEVTRARSLARACGFPGDPDDDGRLRLDLPPAPTAGPRAPGPRPVVVHPGASAPARTWTERCWAGVVGELTRRGHRVFVTGVAGEAPLVDRVADGGRSPGRALALAGRLDVGGLARLLRGSSTLVTGNTGPAHVAAAVDTPVVSVFPPTVPVERWRPWGVPHLVLGDQDIDCAGCRARVCPRPDRPMACLRHLDPPAVADAAELLIAATSPTA